MKKIKIQDIKKKDLDKFYKIKLSNNEFEVIKDFALEENNEAIKYSQRFEIFREYIRAIAWVHYNEKERSKFIFDREGENSPNVDLYDAIYNEIENRYPSEETDDIYSESDEYNEDPIVDNEDKDTFIDKAKGFDPFFFIPDNAFGGFLILVFLTWLIFGVIFDIGTDLGQPRFFGHDGG
ncbi:hypothetical protein IDH30_02640 [Pelagibacterales bacterium SAG-MED15]|nr:hypothetical protein [Pelagibacterales bacterium SAG-MED15]